MGSSVLKPNYNASVNGFNRNQMLWDSESSGNRENISFIFSQVQTESRQRDSRSSESGSKKKKMLFLPSSIKGTSRLFFALIFSSLLPLLCPSFSLHTKKGYLMSNRTGANKFLAHRRCSINKYSSHEQVDNMRAGVQCPCFQLQASPWPFLVVRLQAGYLTSVPQFPDLQNGANNTCED